MLMKVRSSLLACAALFAVPACGGDDAKVERIVEIMEEMGKAAKSGGDDCAKVAANLGPVVDKRAGELKELKEWSESIKSDKEKAKKLMEKHMDRLMKASSDLMDATFKCGDDPAFKAVGEKMKGMM